MRRLLSSQLVEGHADEAEALLHLMARRGIEQDEHTAAVLARTQERLSKRRMWLLVRMLKEGETSRHASGHLAVPVPVPVPVSTTTPTPPLTRAWELYDRLLELGCTDEYHLTAMMRERPSSDLTLILTLPLTLALTLAPSPTPMPTPNPNTNPNPNHRRAPAATSSGLW